jgi:hypothetical protein
MFLNYLTSLKQQILIFLVATSVSIFIVMVSMEYWNKAVQENMQAGQRLDAAKIKYSEAISKKEILKEYKSRYDKLESRNIAGNENRIDWINLLEKIADQEKIPYVNYKIDQQIKSIDNKTKQMYPGMEVFKSVMTLDMKILHEGDIYTIINKLKLNAKGLFDVSSCDIKRIRIETDSIVDVKTGMNFSAKCKLNWYSFKPKSV